MRIECRIVESKILYKYGEIWRKKSGRCRILKDQIQDPIILNVYELNFVNSEAD